MTMLRDCRRLLSYIPMLVIFLVAFIFFAVVALAGASADDEQESQRTKLERIVYQADANLLLTERNTISQLLTDQTLQQFFFSQAITPAEEAQTRRSLQELEASLPIHSSVYLYDYDSQRILSAAGVHSLQQFPDRAYLLDHYREENTAQWTGPRFLEAGGGSGGSREVVSLMRVFADTPSKRGAMVIYVDTDVLERKVNKFVESATGSVELLYGRSDKEKTTSLEGTEVVTSTLVRSEYTGWVYRWKNEYLSGYVPISSEHRRWAGVALLPTTVALIFLALAVRRRPGSEQQEATGSGCEWEIAGSGEAGETIAMEGILNVRGDPGILPDQTSGLSVNAARGQPAEQASTGSEMISETINVPDELCGEAPDPKSSAMACEALQDRAEAPQRAEDEQVTAPEPAELAEADQMPSFEPAQLAEAKQVSASEPPQLAEDVQTSQNEQQRDLAVAAGAQETVAEDEGRRLRGQRLYHDLLTGRIILTEAQYLLRMSELQLSHRFDRIGVFLAEIDGQAAFAAQYPAGGRQLLRYAMEQSLQELAGAHGLSARLVWMKPHRLACVLHLGSSVRESSEPVAGLIEDWQRWVRQYLRMSVSVGIGADSRTIETVAESYRSAYDNLSLKPVFGAGARIDDTCSSCKRSLDSYADLQALEQVVRSLRLMEEDWQGKLALWFQSLREGRVTKRELTMLVHSAMVQMEKEVSVLPANIQIHWKEVFIPRLAELKEQVETLDELEAGLLDQWSAFAHVLEKEREARRPYHLAMQAKAYVDRHFTEPSLSLAAVSSALQVRPSSLSQIFKEELGIKFVDYVIQSRLEHAKRMLAETDEPIQSIAEQSGYPNHISFYRAFKKVLDIPPGEYRSVYRVQ